MDSRQRYSDPEEMMRIFITGLLANARTGMPGYIVSYDPDSVTAVVQLSIKLTTTSQQGVVGYQNYPLLNDVPVEFPGGGGCRLTFPVKEGDECWVSFSFRAIGAWKSYGGIQIPNANRFHDLSDAVCRIGPMSQAKKLSNVSADTVQLRSEDNSTYIELDPEGQVLNFVAPGGLNFTGPAAFSSTITAEGNISSIGGDVAAGDITLKTHLTSGVTDGSGTSGPPIP